MNMFCERFLNIVFVKFKRNKNTARRQQIYHRYGRLQFPRINQVYQGCFGHFKNTKRKKILFQFFRKQILLGGLRKKISPVFRKNKTQSMIYFKNLF